MLKKTDVFSNLWPWLPTTCLSPFGLIALIPFWSTTSPPWDTAGGAVTQVHAHPYPRHGYIHVFSWACWTLLPGLWAENKKATNKWFQFVYSTFSSRIKLVSMCSKSSLWISKAWPVQSSNNCSFCFRWSGFHDFQRTVKEATGLYYSVVLLILNVSTADLSFFLEVPFIWLLRHDAADCPPSSTQAFSSICFSSWQILEWFEAVFKVTFFPDVLLSPDNLVQTQKFN